MGGKSSKVSECLIFRINVFVPCFYIIVTLALEGGGQKHLFISLFSNSIEPSMGS